MAETVGYKCPSCNGPLHFDAETQKLVCDYCESSFEPSYVESHYAASQQKSEQKAATEQQRQEKAAQEAVASGYAEEGEVLTAQQDLDAKAQETQQKMAEDPIQAFLERAPWNEAEELGIRSFTCSSCGAQLSVDATTAVTECPYCGNPTVLPGTLAGILKPDYIIPFKRTKEDALSALEDYYKDKKFLPDAFKTKSHLEHIQGVYVPFWLYTADTEFNARLEATDTRCFTTSDEEITETDHYDVTREGRVHFEGIPVDGSTKMPDAHMDAVEPFDYNEMQPFSVAYLPGYLTERYDMNAQDCSSRATARMDGSIAPLLIDTVKNHGSVTMKGCRTKEEITSVCYVLLPVWMLHTSWNGENYLFAMNGQTGRLIGDLPLDKGKRNKYFITRFLLVFCIIAIIVALVVFL